MLSVPYPESEIGRPLRGCPVTTKPWEVAWLLWKAKTCPGNIVEIGCRFGETTFELASEFQDRTIYAVDCLTEGVIPKWQEHERPSAETVCHLARQLPNVKLVLQDSKTFDYDGKSVGLSFIDGDHSWNGIKEDTRVAWNAGIKHLVWHDYYQDTTMKVKDFLDALDRRIGGKVTLVQSTCLAYLDL